MAWQALSVVDRSAIPSCSVATDWSMDWIFFRSWWNSVSICGSRFVVVRKSGSCFSLFCGCLFERRGEDKDLLGALFGEKVGADGLKVSVVQSETLDKQGHFSCLPLLWRKVVCPSGGVCWLLFLGRKEGKGLFVFLGRSTEVSGVLFFLPLSVFLGFVVVFCGETEKRDKRERGGARRVWDILCELVVGWSSRAKGEGQKGERKRVFVFVFVSSTFSQTQRRKQIKLEGCGKERRRRGGERGGDPRSALGLEGNRETGKGGVSRRFWGKEGEGACVTEAVCERR